MNEYLLAGIAIVVVTALYIVIKLKQRVKQKVQELEIDESIEDIYETLQEEQPQTKKIEEEVKKTTPSTEKKEEPSQTEKTPKPQQKTQFKKKNLKKREPKQHDKITKEDLKEFAHLNILVAEDNIINQKVIAGLLAESGINITFANDGLEAINYINNQRDFDIVLMDANMPNMDGLEATRKIKSHEDFQDIPIIALSGDIAADDIKRMLDAGMDDHLEKPLKIDALYDILYIYTDKKEPTSTIEEKEDNKEVLDVAKGLEISMDEAFYKEILKEFLYNYLNGHNKVKEYIQNNQISKADKLLLDLIGIAANIGAVELHQESIKLKQTLQSNPKPTNELQSFYTAFERLLQQVKRYLAS